jgi:serine/threonine-protein kinase
MNERSSVTISLSPQRGRRRSAATWLGATNPDRYINSMENERDFLEPCPGRASLPADLSHGLRIAGKYELTRKIGSGTMGEVWAAKHLSLQKEVALKLVLRDGLHEDGSPTTSRFLLEARVAAQLSRKTRHIVSVTDHGEDGPYAYLVMELLGGESLEARLARSGPMPLEKVIPLVYQVARALAVAHADGVVHRDLKPSNIFVTVDEEGKALIKILDFGIAKLRTLRRTSLAPGVSKHATMRGFLLGTPVFMSPEQASGKPLDHRADVWALAVMSYHLLTGEFPFDGDSAEELFARVCTATMTPISTHRPELPPALGDLFARAFADRIEHRFQSAVAFATALEQLDTLQRRSAGGSIAPMSSISLPPPPIAPAPVEHLVLDRPSPALGDDAAATGLPAVRPSKPPSRPRPATGKLATESTLIAAGVPRKRELLPRVLAAATVLCVLVVTASVLSIYFERDPGKPRSLTSGAAVGGFDLSQRVNGTAERDLIPPPEPIASSESTTPAASPARAEDPPAAPLSASTPHAPQASTTTASLPPDPPPNVTPPAAPVTSPPSRPKMYDRSEVF